MKLLETIRAIGEDIKLLKADNQKNVGLIQRMAENLMNRLSISETTSRVELGKVERSLTKKITALENKEDRDTIYDDSQLRQKIEMLESKIAETPANDLSQELENLKKLVETSGGEPETGWRDITEYVLKPDGVNFGGASKVFLRRKGDKVWVIFNTFTVNGSFTQQNWLPDEIKAYANPAVMSGNTPRLNAPFYVQSDYQNPIGGQLICVNTNQFAMQINVTSNRKTMYCEAEWVTDTPFPTNPLGTKI